MQRTWCKTLGVLFETLLSPRSRFCASVGYCAGHTPFRRGWREQLPSFVASSLRVPTSASALFVIATTRINTREAPPTQFPGSDLSQLDGSSLLWPCLCLIKTKCRPYMSACLTPMTCCVVLLHFRLPAHTFVVLKVRTVVFQGHRATSSAGPAVKLPGARTMCQRGRCCACLELFRSDLRGSDRLKQADWHG